MLKKTACAGFKESKHDEGYGCSVDPPSKTKTIFLWKDLLIFIVGKAFNRKTIELYCGRLINKENKYSTASELYFAASAPTHYEHVKKKWEDQFLETIFF